MATTDREVRGAVSGAIRPAGPSGVSRPTWDFAGSGGYRMAQLQPPLVAAAGQ